VRVVDGVPDNRVGEVNLDENWGNLVIVYHGPLVYSMVAHLAPGTIKVQEGHIVRRGDVLGSCGNSGRSPYPHLHFQIQNTARIGAPTAPVELHDVVVDRTHGPELRATSVPQEGDTLRNVDEQQDMAQLFRFDIDRPLAFVVQREGKREVERVTPEIDLSGQLLLRSDREGVLYFERSDALFTVADALAPSTSILQLIQAALARVPFEGNPQLRWHDHLPLPRHGWEPLRWAGDLISPFVERRGPRMQYELQLDAGAWWCWGDRPAAGRVSRLCRRVQICDVAWG
jgi:hypothetical protein